MRAALILLVIMLGAAAVVWAARTPRADDKAVQPVALDPVARGKYLVTIMACADCHTPHNEKGELITEMLFAGHPEKAPLPVWEPAMLEKGILATIAPTLTAFAGPFGTSVATNLTPDMETGMGVLSVEGFMQSWRTGQHWKYPRPILPPMPAPFYKDMEEADMRAIFAYLRTVPPVKNRTPESVSLIPAQGH
jgi:hypothetical protein